MVALEIMSKQEQLVAALAVKQTAVLLASLL